MKSSMLIILVALLFSSAAFAKLNVVTTTTDLRAIVSEVAGNLVNVDSIAKGTQDPHFIEAKPSFMLKANKADLIVAVGLELEIGWLPSIIQGARNPKILKGQNGYLEVGSLVEPLEVPTGAVTRAQGDVHPLGNPHVTLDPIRAGEIAGHIADRLSELDSGNAAKFAANAKAFRALMEEKAKEWAAQIQKSDIKSVVTYHKTLTYFFDRFKLQNPAILEPKPGIPPTSAHIMDVIEVMRKQKVPLVLVENFFDPTVTNKIKQELPGVRTQTVPVAVDGAPGVSSLDALYATLVKAVVGK